MIIVDKYIKPDHFQIGKKLGDGADGEVFEYNDKVIKFSISFDDSYLQKIDLLKCLKEANEKPYVKIYEFKHLLSTKTKYQDVEIYYSILEKLNKISDDEKKLFHTLICHEDQNKIKTRSKNEVDKIIDELNYYLDFNKDKVILFLDQLKNSKFNHLDIHVRNVMKDSFGNFKLIDLDRIEKI